MAKVEIKNADFVPNHRGAKVGSIIVFTEESAPNLPLTYLTYHRPYVITEIDDDMAVFEGDDGEGSAFGSNHRDTFVVIHNGHTETANKTVTITLENQNEIDAFTTLIGSTNDDFSALFKLPQGTVVDIFDILDEVSSYRENSNYPTLVGCLSLI